MPPPSRLVAALLALGAAGAAATEPPRFTGATEVTGSRVASDPVEIGRRVVVLEREEIRRLPAHNLHDLLALLPGVGLSRRGARGVQADLGVRGGTFEQSAVLVNGLRVNDPQTGHFNLDLFLPLEVVERVEVLYGPGSAVYGPDAFGGVVNIVTGASTPSARVVAGEHGLAGAAATAVLGGGAWVSLEREVHTGFIDGAEADVNQAAAGWSWRRAGAAVEVLASAGERSFGALGFYSAAFPYEHETTAGRFMTAVADVALGSRRLRLGGRIGAHSDDFVLDRTRPAWYRNLHDTDGRLLTASLQGTDRGWRWALGLEAGRDAIDSSSLGRHHRTRSAAFAELGRSAGLLELGLQARLDHQEPWGTVGTLAGGGAVRLGRTRLRVHHGQSFRPPSFTELYYDSPATVGDPDLAPERGRTTEVGIQGDRLGATLFERRTRPVIDFVLQPGGVWRARNLGHVRTRGVELEAFLPAAGPLQMQRLTVVALSSDSDLDPQRSRYALTHPRLEAAWSGVVVPAPRWRGSWALRLRDPAASGSWTALDLRLDRELGRDLTLTLQAENLLDREVVEVPGVPLPGRWASATLAWRPR